MIRQIIDDHDQILADIDALKAALPLDEDDARDRLLKHLAICHNACNANLGGLLKEDRL